MIGGVRFSVEEASEDILVYHCANIHEAREIFEFIRDFFPEAKFVFQPLVH